jgi:predicted GH43/DUF377 family glycosyl hydrolase
MDVQRTDVVLNPDKTRVLLRPFQWNDAQRMRKILCRLGALAEEQVDAHLAEVMAEFASRHRRAVPLFLEQFAAVKDQLPPGLPLSENRKLLVGAYFACEYSVEAAALFNPSLVWHPDQSGLQPYQRRFLVGLRATGEGHVSSIVFRAGVVDGAGRITLEPGSRFVTAPTYCAATRYEKELFRARLAESGLTGACWDAMAMHLDGHFTLRQLRDAAGLVRRLDGIDTELRAAAEQIVALAAANYEVAYRPEQDLSERILFPRSGRELRGMEDARFVAFRDDDGSTRYYATYSAYDGRRVWPQLIETDDFLRFKVSTLHGAAAENKGMALFPRKINGHYAMLGRQDGENIFLMYAGHPHFWHTKQVLLRPMYSWEFVQLGNCGSPIETEAGWLVLTHGVGASRKYAIGACLLDRDDPSRVIGRLREPLLTANACEREGYVPNVVYSCGGQVHAGRLILPYAMSDQATSFATVDLHELLAAMQPPAARHGIVLPQVDIATLPTGSMS